MSSYVMLNRRKGNERRICDTRSELEHRRADPRRHKSNTYFLVVGNGGIDGFSLACLISLLLITAIVTMHF